MLNLSKIRTVSLVSIASLGFAAGCGGMSATDLREDEMDEAALEEAENQGGDGENQKDESQATALEGDEAKPEEGSGDSIVDDDADKLIVDVDVTVTSTSKDDEADAMVEDEDTSTENTADEADAPIVIPEIPGPDILGSPSEAPIEATLVPPEAWVPEEGLGGVEQSGVELEVVDDLSVLVIFDNSGSMEGYWDGRTRWEAANQSLYAALAPVWSSLKVAAVRFPMETDCGVPDFDAEAQFEWNLAGDFLDEWIANAHAPIGGTPLGSAFIAADAAIAEASERGLLEDRFNVLLLTDGEPNCGTEKALLTELPSKWLSMGVKTHVLGLPGSQQAAQLLNAIAVAGGTAQPIDVETPDQLDDEVLHLAR